MAAIKTDANDSDGLAYLAEVGFCREVRVKGFDSMLTRTLVAARTRLVRSQTEFSNQIRGLMKTFGLVLPAEKGSTFQTNVRGRLDENPELAATIIPLLEAWCSIRPRAAELNRPLINDTRQSEACQLLMSISVVGVVTASAFATAVEDPASFPSSRCIGAWLGLTTRRCQSGLPDYNGHISRRGDHQVRSLLLEAACVILTRSSAESALRE